MKDTFIIFGIFYRHLEKLNCLQGYSWDLSMGEGRSHYVTPILLLQASCHHTSCVLLKVTICLMSNKWFMQYRFFGFTFFCYLIVRLYVVKFKKNNISKSPRLHLCSSICKAIFKYSIFWSVVPTSCLSLSDYRLNQSILNHASEVLLSKVFFIVVSL